MLSATTRIIPNLLQLARYKSEVMLVWSNRFNVLVVEGQNSNENFQGVFNEASMILNEKGVEERFIFISRAKGNVKKINSLRCTFCTQLTDGYDD
jgi:PP-loop superfamily ATP-utilizing enzyme